MSAAQDVLKGKENMNKLARRDDPYLNTLNLIAQKDDGTLLVMGGERFSGIVSQRDSMPAITEFTLR